MTLGAIKAGAPPGLTPPARDKAAEARLDAARKFEALVMQQLLSVMRATAKNGGMMGSSGASGQYLSMFDEVIAERLAEGGGIGLSEVLVQALGGTSSESHGAANTQPALPSPHGGVTPPLPNLEGATARLAHAAYALSVPDGGKQWSKEGTLTPRDLASPLATPTKEGTAHFNVRDAQGYRDAFKCNLFALEAARRAGFQVPVVARERGWGFPTSNALTHDAADGRLRGDWARVIRGSELGGLPEKLAQGELGVVLTGSGTEGRHGHMAVVERIHRMELDAHGELSRIEFDGWEARKDGAQHLTRRTWSRDGAVDDQRRARTGFGRIELLALRPAAAPEKAEIPLSSKTAASVYDRPSSSAPDRPNPRPEDTR